jgi:hypothetical protein
MTITNQPTATDPLNPLVNAMVAMNLGVPSRPFATGPAEGFLDSPTKSPVKQQDERNDDELDDVEEEMSYKPYRPPKLLFGKDHPDPVVENATLAAVSPPDISYNLALPANIISEGKLSNLQLEAIVYGQQRFEVNMGTNKDGVEVGGAVVNLPAEGKVVAKDRVPLPARCGFMLGGKSASSDHFFAVLFCNDTTNSTFILFLFRQCRDGEGEDPRRICRVSLCISCLESILQSFSHLITILLFIFRENISRGRKKHIWISVSADLYEDAKRDLSDLGLNKYAETKCYSLKNFKSQDTIKQAEGVMFTTYSTLIAKNRLDQLLQWCGGDNDLDSFDGLICLDECHRCKSIELDGEGNAKKGSSKTGNVSLSSHNSCCFVRAFP